MDIYFCDECSARVTDLDLRAGKGMRKEYDTICSGCVDRGQAGAWLIKVGQSAPATGAVAAAQTPAASSASLAIADPPNRISVARDFVRTAVDDPFSVVDASPNISLPAPEPGAETDAILASASKRAPQSATKTPSDILAVAGGGFGALIGSGEGPAKGDDEPADKGLEIGSDLKLPKAESPFGFIHPKDNDNPGKSETSEIDAADAADAVEKDEAKLDDEAKPSRSGSGRQRSSKRGSTASSKRTVPKHATTRRLGTGRAKGNKVILLSLVSCGVMMILFFGFVLPNAGGKKADKPQQISDEPLIDLKSRVDAAKKLSHKALQSDVMAEVKAAVSAQEAMMQAFYVFQKAADKRGWTEDNYGAQLDLIGFNEARSMSKAVRDRAVVIEQRK